VFSCSRRLLTLFARALDQLVCHGDRAFARTDHRR
jgi:hypothetical protein